MIERSALLPKAPYLVTETMIKGYEDQWNQANVQSRPYLPYNPDTKAPNAMPERMAPLDLPQGALSLAQMSIQDIQATIGYFDPALGNAEDMNRVSGKALVQHTKRSDLGSYEFIDGYRQALQLTWEMMIDMIPFTYDSERVVQIIGHDGVEQMVKINEQSDLTDDIMNDLSKGSYGVEVTIGPSFQSARQEALDTLLSFTEALPTAAPAISDLIAKNIDVPDAQEMARRLRIPLIQQGLVQPTEAELKANPNIAQPTPAQQMAQQNQQNEAKLLAAKAQKMGADAAIATSRAQASPLEQEKLKLGNMKLAAGIHDSALQHAGINVDAAADAQANQQELQHQANLNAQELQHNEATHRQGLSQENQEHIAGVLKGRSEHESEEERLQREHEREERRAQEKHEREERRKEEAHRKEMQRLDEKHAAELAHAAKLNEAKVSAAKAMAKAKPKAPTKKAA
jgi:hypothetical protein